VSVILERNGVRKWGDVWYARLWDRFNNWLAVDTELLESWAVAWDNEGVWNPPADSNFYNGYASLRITRVRGKWWRTGIYVHFRFTADRRTQFGINTKTNGRFGLTFRPWQSNEAAAAGVHGHNYGHAAAWNRGPA